MEHSVYLFDEIKRELSHFLFFYKMLLYFDLLHVQSVLHNLAGVETCFLKLSEEPK